LVVVLFTEVLAEATDCIPLAAAEVSGFAEAVEVGALWILSPNAAAL
jgi:hypothetical protein